MPKIKRMRLRTLLLFVIMLFNPYSANAESFEAWRADYTQRAVQSGIPAVDVARALENLTYHERIVELDRKQPDGQMTLQQYVERTVSQQRIDKGRIMLRQHYDLLKQTEKAYGVSPDILVALWGKETEYGGYTGNFETISALATLAYEGRRRDFFEKELQHAIILLTRLKWRPDQMHGSWAGAIGQCQFMPSNYIRFAVDGNRNGRTDLWNELPDIFASMGNLLRHKGWQAGQRWGQRVTVTRPIAESILGRDKAPRSLTYWQEQGVRFDHAVPQALYNNIRLYQPDGPDGPAYALYPNFDVLMRWNRSGYFATGVGRLSDHLANL